MSSTAPFYYSNPVGDREAPDPFVTYDNKLGYYYLLYTRGREVRVYRSRRLDTIMNDQSLQVFAADGKNGIFGSIWAPEMHFYGGLWYVCTSGSTEPEGREERRLFVLRSRSSDPFDGFDFAGFPDRSLAAIDPTLFVLDQSLYMCYAAENRGNRLHVRKMKSPLEFDGGSAMICEAELDWERVPPYVGEHTIVEGPFFVSSPDGARHFILYSANGCWSDCYRLGVLEYTGGDPVSKSGWKKHPDYIFGSGNGTFGPGHMSFFKSPDGRSLWMAYHSMHASNVSVTWAPRYLHFQKLEFSKDGFPLSAEPLPMGRLYPEPS